MRLKDVTVIVEFTLSVISITSTCLQGNEEETRGKKKKVLLHSFLFLCFSQDHHWFFRAFFVCTEILLLHTF